MSRRIAVEITRAELSALLQQVEAQYEAVYDYILVLKDRYGETDPDSALTDLIDYLKVHKFDLFARVFLVDGNLDIFSCSYFQLLESEELLKRFERLSYDIYTQKRLIDIIDDYMDNLLLEHVMRRRNLHRADDKVETYEELVDVVRRSIVTETSKSG